MQLFYLENTNQQTELNAIESRHAIKVLRKKTGDILICTDGKGWLYETEITSTKNNQCQLNIINKKKQRKQHNYSLHIAISPTKNMDRFEFFLEKTTEIGINQITPIICKNSERKKIKLERCKKIILAATKQSLKYYLPIINEPTTVNKIIEKISDGKKYIAHCKGSNKKELRNEKPSKSILILIGPEGDFSENEIKKAIEHDFQEISLSNSRLRTETAGIIAAHTIKLKE